MNDNLPNMGSFICPCKEEIFIPYIRPVDVPNWMNISHTIVCERCGRAFTINLKAEKHKLLGNI